MCQREFEELKRAFVSALVLPYADLSLPCLLDTDASAGGRELYCRRLMTGKNG